MPCAGLAVLATLAAIAGERSPAVAQLSARYELTITGKWNADALANGVHNANSTFWQVGNSASSGLETLTESANVNDFSNEIRN